MEPGYDEATGQYYVPLSTILNITQAPSREDVREAVGLLDEAWFDHPFDSAASRANTFGLALTEIVRPLLDGSSTPLAIIDATRAGSGKTLLAIILSLISTGMVPATMSAPHSADEWRKQITAQLRRSEPFIVVDDVTGTINNPPLRRALTSPTWSDRLLGASSQLRIPSSATWCATGNNLRPSGDMVRRCYLIRLDTRMVRPHRRSGFKHPQPQWAKEHRAHLAAALLTLVRAWIVAGRPEPDVTVMGGFEKWTRVVGGVLQHAGIEGFLDNLNELEDTAFGEDNMWSSALEAIHKWASDRGGDEVPTFTARDLARALEQNFRSEADFRDPVVTTILEHLPDALLTKLRHRESIAQSLGKTLQYRLERRYPGGWHIRQVDRGREGVQWEVHCDDVTIDSDSEGGPSPHPSPSDEGGGGGAPKAVNLSSHRHTETQSAPF